MTRYHTSTQALPPLGDKGHAYARRRRWCNGSLQCRRKNELMGVGVAVPLGWREEQARWARGDQPGACGSGDQRRPRGYVVRDLIPPVACTCSWKLVAGLYCRGVSRPGQAALSLWTHCGNEPRRVVDALRQRTACRISLLFPCEVSAMATVVSAALLPLGDQDWMAAHTACHVLARGG